MKSAAGRLQQGHHRVSGIGGPFADPQRLLNGLVEGALYGARLFGSRVRGA